MRISDEMMARLCAGILEGGGLSSDMSKGQYICTLCDKKLEGTTWCISVADDYPDCPHFDIHETCLPAHVQVILALARD